MIVVVTGGFSGIGAALVDAFSKEGAIVAIADLQHHPQKQLQPFRATQEGEMITNSNANSCQSQRHHWFHIDVTNSIQVRNMISKLMEWYGRIDIYCSNAGILYQPTTSGGSSAQSSVTQHTDHQWNRIFQVNTLSHVIALRELLPYWNKHGMNIQSDQYSDATSTNQCQRYRRDGRHRRPIFLINASAAGLLTQIGNASYGVSKGAAVSLAEHIAIEHDNILQVYCLCPQAVDTPMVRSAITSSSNSSTGKQREQGDESAKGSSWGEKLTYVKGRPLDATTTTTTKQKAVLNSAMTDGVMKPWQVAQCTIETLKAATISSSASTASSSIFIFPHSKVPLYFQRKATDHSRWIKGMQRLKRHVDLSASSTTSTSAKPSTSILRQSKL